MSYLELLSSRAWEHLVWALLHTLWQGALIGLLMSVALRRMPAHQSNGRYLVALAAQFAVLLTGLLAWSVLDQNRNDPAPRAEDRALTSTLEPSGAVWSAPATRLLPGIQKLHGVREHPAWTPILAAVWLVGVGLMLTRIIASVFAASRLASGTPVTDSAILALLEQTRRELSIGRVVKVCAVGENCGPAVIGAIWPTLTLPISMLTGLSSELLRLIIIHELAHVRRYDYLVNIAQMLIEAILFFNPSVWWIGRQVRLEREACCDAMVVRLTGHPLAYARALAGRAQRGRMLATVLAWNSGRRPSALLDRIRRVLRPTDKPALRLSLSGLILLLVAGPLILMALWSSTNAVVGLAAQALTPNERLARVKVAQAGYAPALSSTGGKATLKGTVRTPSGQAPSRPITFFYKSDTTLGGTIMGSLNRVRGDFSAEVVAGTVWLSLEPNDYAPTVVGPFNAAPGKTVEGIDIVLDAGFPAHFRVNDERGLPISGVRVTGALDIGGSSQGSSEGWVTDRNGMATIPHAARKAYRLSAQAVGLQTTDVIVMTPTPEEVFTIELKRARPTRGIAVDRQSHPVVGAAVRLFFRKRNDSASEGYSDRGPLLATTDATGRFVLDSLTDGSIYTVLIVSKAGGLGIARRVRPGQDGIHVTVGPRLTINGTIIGNSGAVGSKPRPATVDVTQWFGVDHESDGEGGVTRRVLVNAKGHFTISGLLQTDAVLEAGGRTVRVSLDRAETSATIDLSRTVPSSRERRVILRFVPTDGGGPVTGGITVNGSAAGGGTPWANLDLCLDKDKAAFDTSAPGTVWVQPGTLVGYWFLQHGVEVVPGDGAQTIDIPVLPAGAITGQVLQADGQPAVSGVEVSCLITEAPPGLQKSSIAGPNSRVDTDGRFLHSPLPIGGTYVVVATRGNNKQFSSPVKIDAAKPTAHVDLRLSRTVAVAGRLAEADGKPLAGIPVQLRFKQPSGGESLGRETPTDLDGRFRFDDLSAEFAANYRVSVDSRERFQPAESALIPGGASVDIRLQPGHVITGRIVDDATGQPIPGVEFYTHRPTRQSGERYAYEAEGKSDEQGRFRFSNLAKGSYQLNDRSGLIWTTPDKSLSIESDGSESIEIRARLPSWSKLKPVPAGAQ